MADDPRKWAGKYDSPEELEKGLLNLIPAFEQVKAEADRARAEAVEARKASQLYQEQVQTLSEMVNRIGEVKDPGLDDQSIQAYIDRKINGIEAKLSKIPDAIDSRLKAIVEPLAAVQNAKMAYIGANEDFDDGAVGKFLAVNPGINKVYQRLLSDPDSAGEAFKYVHDMYKSAAGKPKQTSVDADRKRDAGSPRASNGPPVEIPGGDQATAEEMQARAMRAQSTMDFTDELAYMKEYLKGSKLLSDLETTKPDWARD